MLKLKIHIRALYLWNWESFSDQSLTDQLRINFDFSLHSSSFNEFDTKSLDKDSFIKKAVEQNALLLTFWRLWGGWSNHEFNFAENTNHAESPIIKKETLKHVI